MNDTELLKFYLRLRQRQREVVELACEGFSNREIAQRLVIEPSVVAEHLSTVYADLKTEAPYAHRRVNRAVLISLFAPFLARHPEMRNRFDARST